MTLQGKMLIGQQAVQGSRDAIYAINPANNERLEPAYLGGSQEEVERACELAWRSFDSYRETQLETRAQFIETIADEIESL